MILLLFSLKEMIGSFRIVSQLGNRFILRHQV
jgi:hypothetical protein